MENPIGVSRLETEENQEVGVFDIEEKACDPEAPQVSQDEEKVRVEVEDNEDGKSRKREKIKQYVLYGALGALAVSTAVSFTYNPVSETLNELKQVAPWVAGGLIGTESMWIGGAALMAGSVGRRVGNPFKLKSRLSDIGKEAVNSKEFKAGLAINTIGAIGSTAVVMSGTVAALPELMWPSMFAISSIDLATTVGIRAAIYKTIPKREKIIMETKSELIPKKDTGTNVDLKPEAKKKPEVKGRIAKMGDATRLAEIDLERFKSSYGANMPSKEEVTAMFEQRIKNAGDFMFVVEIDGRIEGFATAFRTNKPLESFESWEKSTNNGTLEGVVDPNGKYGYIANLTMNPVAVANHGETILFTNLFAKAVGEGLDYGYFISRMPQFRTWLKIEQRNGRISKDLTKEELDDIAQRYSETQKETPKGLSRFDYELRMYEEIGLELGKAIPNAFSDEASLDYGVICKVPLPKNRFIRNVKPIRYTISSIVKMLSKYPELVERYI